MIQIKTNDSLFKIGEMAIVFDCYEWQKTGDIGDNKQFNKLAEVIRVKRSKWCPYEWLADVKFDGNRISRGHFQSMMKHDFK